MPIQIQTEMVPRAVVLIGIYFLDTEDRKTLRTSVTEQFISYYYIDCHRAMNAHFQYYNLHFNYFVNDLRPFLYV